MLETLEFNIFPGEKVGDLLNIYVPWHNVLSALGGCNFTMT